MNLKLFRKKNSELARCPGCNEIASLRRSRSRNIIEKFLRKFKFSPYSCQVCGWRGRLFTYKFSKNFSQLVLMYIFIAVFAAILVRKFLNYFD